MKSILFLKLKTIKVLILSLLFMTNYTATASIKNFFSGRASQQRIDSSIQLLNSQRTKHNEAISVIQNKIDKVKAELDELENESKILRELWLEDKSSFTEAVEEKYRIISELHKIKNELSSNILLTEINRNDLEQIESDIKHYEDCIRVMMHNNVDKSDQSPTRILINESYRSDFDQILAKKENYQNELGHLEREYEKVKHVILVEFNLANNSNKNYTVIDNQFEEKLKLLFEKDEINSILKKCKQLLNNRPRISIFHIYYQSLYIISLKFKKDKVVLNYYKGQMPRVLQQDDNRN